MGQAVKLAAAGAKLLASAQKQMYGDPVELITLESVRTRNAVTGEYETTNAPAVRWSGLGSLQQNVSGGPAVVADDSGGAKEVAVAWRAYLPFEAQPVRGWILKDASGRHFHQVTVPINPGGVGAAWILNLGEPA